MLPVASIKITVRLIVIRTTPPVWEKRKEIENLRELKHGLLTQARESKWTKTFSNSVVETIQEKIGMNYRCLARKSK